MPCSRWLQNGVASRTCAQQWQSVPRVLGSTVHGKNKMEQDVHQQLWVVQGTDCLWNRGHPRSEVRNLMNCGRSAQKCIAACVCASARATVNVCVSSLLNAWACEPIASGPACEPFASGFVSDQVASRTSKISVAGRAPSYLVRPCLGE